jgi:type III pantothenate kinase
MILAVDIGNTNITFGIYDKMELHATFSLETNARYTATTYFIQLSEMLKFFLIDDISKIMIASVVPKLDRVFVEISDSFFKKPHHFISKNDIPLVVNINNPSELGIDRLINAYAAYCINKANTIIIDIGTATTFDILLQEGIYDGGMIFPGLELSIQALRNGTAKLPDVQFKKPNDVIGKTTSDAIQSGFYFGYLGALKEISGRISSEHKRDFKTIITGGFSDIFSNEIECLKEKNLTLYGIAKITILLQLG